jgi:phage tail P2-like protein
VTTSNNPYFRLFPLNNARTGFKPYAMPVIYIERYRLTNDGLAIGNSETQKIRYYIVDAPDTAKVAGPFNINLRVPNISLYEIDLTAKQLSDIRIQIDGFQFYKRVINTSGVVTYNPIDFSEAETGDFFDYSLDLNDVTDKVEYFKDAYYYDLSSITITVDGLPKPQRYFFIWEATFFRRITTLNGNLKCISADIGMSNEILEINHPGEVHHAMWKGTPSLYFNYEGYKESADPTLEFYRPFADLLQDIFDEQKLLDGINQINTVPAAFIPYLAYLIGWDLPNYPGVSDDLRRKILKQAVNLQKLKGSKRVINELFEMFGFTVNIINLWANKVGNKLLSANDGINTSHVVQVDQLLSNYNAEGFSAGVIPLTFIPDRNVQIVLYAYQVKQDSDDYKKLIDFSNNLSSDLEFYNDNVVRTDINNIITTKSMDDLNSSFTDGLIGSTKLLIDSINVDGISYQIYGKKILNSVNVSYNNNENAVFLNYDHELSVDGGKVFVFAIYERTKLIITNDILNTRSSRFDTEIFNKDNSPIDFNLLIYMLSFIFKLKAFHSLLRKIKFTIDTYEVYNVIDFCMSGTDILKPNTDAGDLQVPPPIIPSEDECLVTNRNFKDSDIKLKNLIVNGLEDEFQGWKNQRTIDSDGHEKGKDCELNKEGQDKVLVDNTDFDHNIDDRKTYCVESPSKPDFCYKGRVTSEESFTTESPLEEIYINVPCGPKLGYGVYWEEKSLVNLDHQHIGFLKSRLIFVDNKNTTLHYSAYPYFDINIHKSQNTLALNPLSLSIEKEHLGFPSHRFLSMAYLFSDYNYTLLNISYGYDIARKRPWDEESQCGYYLNTLNAKLSPINGKPVRIFYNGTSYDVVEEFTGLMISSGFATYDDADTYINSNDLFVEQSLTWDDGDLIYIGNGIESEIDSLTDHTIVTGDTRLITHNVYQYTQLNPYVSDDFTISSSSRISTNNDYGQIFDSACKNTNEDYVGGYPSKTNIIPISGNYRFDDIDSSGLIDRPSIASALGIPLNPLKTTARFFENSMIFVNKNEFGYQYVKPYRLDCSCIINDCDPTDVTYENNMENCKSEALFDKSGNLDPSPDKIEFDFTALLIEKMSLCSRLSNHEIKNLFCIKEDCSLPESGSFRYKDDYQIIYELSWITINDILDLIFITKDPKIPGANIDEYIENGRLFVKGIITTTRQIIRNGTIIEAEGIEQIVDYYQTNVKCGDIAFENPFSYGIDCAIHDDIEFAITDGPKWMDPEELGPGGTFIELVAGPWKTQGTVWADVVLETFDVTYPTQNSLIWIDFVSSVDHESSSSKSSLSESNDSSSSLSALSLSSSSSSSLSSKSLSSGSSSESSSTSSSLSTQSLSSSLSTELLSSESSSSSSTESLSTESSSSSSTESLSTESSSSSSTESLSTESSSSSLSTESLSSESLSSLSSSLSTKSSSLSLSSSSLSSVSISYQSTSSQSLSSSSLSESLSTESSSSRSLSSSSSSSKSIASSPTSPTSESLSFSSSSKSIVSSPTSPTSNTSSSSSLSSQSLSSLSSSSSTNSSSSSTNSSLSSTTSLTSDTSSSSSLSSQSLSSLSSSSSTNSSSSSSKSSLTSPTSPTSNTSSSSSKSTASSLTSPTSPTSDISSSSSKSTASSLTSPTSPTSDTSSSSSKSTASSLTSPTSPTSNTSSSSSKSTQSTASSLTSPTSSTSNTSSSSSKSTQSTASSLTSPTSESSSSGDSQRGLFAGGYATGGFVTSSIDYITIVTTGNSTNFGNLTLARYALGSCSSSTRGVFGGGNGDDTFVSDNVIDYVTIATTGNAADFGDLTVDKEGVTACSNSTRGVFSGGYSGQLPGYYNVIDYVTIATTGNATDFGDVAVPKYYSAACSSTTRGIFGGGADNTNNYNIIDYITIASTTDTTDFGDLIIARSQLGGCSSSTRGIFGGGNAGSVSNVIDYITIASTGNATDFGDLTLSRQNISACSSLIRGIFGGGHDDSGTYNTIDYITIASTGNATDFGDLATIRSYLASCSNAHGGL